MILEDGEKRYKMEKREATVGELVFLHHSVSVVKVELVYGGTVVTEDKKEVFHSDYIVLIEQ